MQIGTGLALLLSTGASVAASALTAGGGPKPEAQVRPVSRNMAAEATRRGDALRKRLGVGANELTGGGAEAQTAGGKVLLGQ